MRTLPTIASLLLPATLALALAGVPARPAAAQADGPGPYGQPNDGALAPIVGVWSATTRLSNGQPNGSLFVQIGPDGGFALRSIVLGGTTDYVGACRFDPGSGVLTFVVNAYQPQTLPPQFQPGVTYRFQLQMTGPNTMLLQDAGGPVELHRQI